MKFSLTNETAAQWPHSHPQYSMPVGSNFLVSAKGLRYLIMEREENFCWTSAAHQRGAGELLNREKLPLKIGINSV